MLPGLLLCCVRFARRGRSPLSPDNLLTVICSGNLSSSSSPRPGCFPSPSLLSVLPLILPFLLCSVSLPSNFHPSHLLYPFVLPSSSALFPLLLFFSFILLSVSLIIYSFAIFFSSVTPSFLQEFILPFCPSVLLCSFLSSSHPLFSGC